MATQDSPNLYERLGGVYSIATVVDDLIDREGRVISLGRRAALLRANSPTTTAICVPPRRRRAWCSANACTR
jgi:hypothetical protein